MTLTHHSQSLGLISCPKKISNWSFTTLSTSNPTSSFHILRYSSTFYQAQKCLGRSKFSAPASFDGSCGFRGFPCKRTPVQIESLWLGHVMNSRPCLLHEFRRNLFHIVSCLSMFRRLLKDLSLCFPPDNVVTICSHVPAPELLCSTHL